MDRLTKEELEEYWFLSFEEEDAETCFAIDAYYLQKYGPSALHIWICKRI